MTTCRLRSVSSAVEGLVPESWALGVFGSAAKCERWYGQCRAVTDGSDVDLLIVYPDRSPAEAMAVRRAVAESLREIAVPADIVLLSRTEISNSGFWTAEKVREIRECPM